MRIEETTLYVHPADSADTYLGTKGTAIVASTLAIAALFNPLRRRIRRLIDKRFERRK